MKRVAILLDKNLTIGQKANVSAILMGQLSLLSTELFHSELLCDTNGNIHAAIRYSTVLLEANSSTQIINFIYTLDGEFPHIQRVVFSKTGQGLNNEFETYTASVRSSSLDGLWPVGIAVFWEDEEVRRATKKFSLLQ